MFLIEAETTGIDPFTDRIIQLYAVNVQTLKEFWVNIKQLSTPVTSATVAIAGTAEPFGEAIVRMFDWMEEQKQPGDGGPTYLVANQGHYFVFPLLTKEMRRARTDIKRIYLLWDLMYTFHRQAAARYDSSGNARERAHHHISQFRTIAGCEMSSATAFEILNRDNEEYTSKNPQPVLRTKHLRVN